MLCWWTSCAEEKVCSQHIMSKTPCAEMTQKYNMRLKGEQLPFWFGCQLCARTFSGPLCDFQHKVFSVPFLSHFRQGNQQAKQKKACSVVEKHHGKFIFFASKISFY